MAAFQQRETRASFVGDSHLFSFQKGTISGGINGNGISVPNRELEIRLTSPPLFVHTNQSEWTTSPRNLSVNTSPSAFLGGGPIYFSFDLVDGDLNVSSDNFPPLRPDMIPTRHISMVGEVRLGDIHLLSGTGYRLTGVRSGMINDIRLHDIFYIGFNPELPLSLKGTVAENLEVTDARDIILGSQNSKKFSLKFATGELNVGSSTFRINEGQTVEIDSIRDGFLILKRERGVTQGLIVQFMASGIKINEQEINKPVLLELPVILALVSSYVALIVNLLSRRKQVSP